MENSYNVMKTPPHRKPERKVLSDKSKYFVKITDECGYSSKGLNGIQGMSVEWVGSAQSF